MTTISARGASRVRQGPSVGALGVRRSRVGELVHLLFLAMMALVGAFALRVGSSATVREPSSVAARASRHVPALAAAAQRSARRGPSVSSREAAELDLDDDVDREEREAARGEGHEAKVALPRAVSVAARLVHGATAVAADPSRFEVEAGLPRGPPSPRV